MKSYNQEIEELRAIRRSRIEGVVKLELERRTELYKIPTPKLREMVHTHYTQRKYVIEAIISREFQKNYEQVQNAYSLNYDNMIKRRKANLREFVELSPEYTLVIDKGVYDAHNFKLERNFDALSSSRPTLYLDTDLATRSDSDPVYTMYVSLSSFNTGDMERVRQLQADLAETMKIAEEIIKIGEGRIKYRDR